MELKGNDSSGCQLKECINYFKERSVYQKLFEKMREKYESLGRIGGTVHLSGLTKEEYSQLAGFFQKDFQEKEKVSISAVSMEKALAASRFSCFTWEEILQGFFHSRLTVKKEQRQREEEEREHYFRLLLESAPTGAGHSWLSAVLKNREEGYRLLMKECGDNRQSLSSVLTGLLGAIPCLPFLKDQDSVTGYKLLPVFAAETTGNPHFFDAGTVAEQLLLCFLKKTMITTEDKISLGRKEKSELLQKAGLLRDDLSNHTLIYGIMGQDQEGKVHRGMESFVLEKDPMILTLKTIGKLKKVSPQAGNRVYIVENPAIFSKFVQEWPQEAIVCGNGQIRLATYALLDLFEPEVSFFYAGDFDPEGLLIAQNLKERYGKRLHLWKYEVSLYETYRSEVEITEKSLKKLDKIESEELLAIKEALEKQRKAAYQESMWREYLR